MLNPFYIPTYRKDLKYVNDGSEGNHLRVENVERVLDKWNQGQGIFIEIDGVITFYKVNGVRYILSSGIQTLELDEDFPSEIHTAKDVKIGFLEKVRLNNPVVEIVYGNDGEKNIFDVFIEIATIVDYFYPVNVEIDSAADGIYGDIYSSIYDRG